MRKFVTSAAIFFALTTSVGADTGKKTFIALDGCQRTYVQQVLSDKGLYSSGIDGLWGKGTAKALAKYSEGQTKEKVLKKLSKNKACKKNPDRLKYSKFEIWNSKNLNTNKLSKSFVLTVPNYEKVINKYGEGDFVPMWIREWLDEYAACYGIKVENMETEFKTGMEFDFTTGKPGPTYVKVQVAC